MELLVRCFEGEASLLDVVLREKLAPLLELLEDSNGAAAKAGAPLAAAALRKLAENKPAAAWRSDELACAHALCAAGAALPPGLHSRLADCLRVVCTDPPPAAEAEYVASMLDLVRQLAECLGVTVAPAAAKPEDGAAPAAVVMDEEAVGNMMAMAGVVRCCCRHPRFSPPHPRLPPPARVGLEMLPAQGQRCAVPATSS